MLLPGFDDYEPDFVSGSRAHNMSRVEHPVELSTVVGLTSERPVRYCRGQNEVPQSFVDAQRPPSSGPRKAATHTSTKSMHAGRRPPAMPALHTNPLPQGDPFIVPYNQDFTQVGVLLLRTALRHLTTVGKMSFIKSMEPKNSVGFGESHLEVRVDVQELVAQGRGGNLLEHPSMASNVLVTGTSRNHGCWLVDEKVSIHVVLSRCEDLQAAGPLASTTGRHSFGPVPHVAMAEEEEGLIIALAHVPDYQSMLRTGRSSWGGMGGHRQFQDGRHPWEPSYLETCAFKLFTTGGPNRRRRQLYRDAPIAPYAPPSPVGIVGRREVRGGNGAASNLDNTSILRVQRGGLLAPFSTLDPFDEYEPFEVPLVRQQDAAAIAALKAAGQRAARAPTRTSNALIGARGNKSSAMMATATHDRKGKESCAAWSVRGVLRHPLAKGPPPSSPAAQTFRAAHSSKRDSRVVGDDETAFAPLPDFGCEDYAPALLPEHYVDNRASQTTATEEGVSPSSSSGGLMGDTKGLTSWDWDDFSRQLARALTHILTTRRGGASLAV